VHNLLISFQQLHIAIADKVTAANVAETNVWETDGSQQTLMDQYDCVMYGKIFKIKEEGDKM
jgi:hypothetical protein